MPLLPASFFGMVLGLVGFGNGWRIAVRLWNLPAFIGEAILLAGSVLWAVLVILYVAKWLFARDAALAEVAHPVQCCFVGLVGVATMLVAGAAIPMSRDIAIIIYALGVAFTLGFGVWRSGQLWHGERDPGTSTPVLYLPLVAGNFVGGTVAGALGYPDWGALAFGTAFFAWLAIESVLLHRLYTGPALPPALRPTLGIQLAPPVVGAVSYLAVHPGAPDILAQAMLGYGLMQALLLLRLLPWIREQPFAPSYWAFSFGVTALANGSLIMTERGLGGAVATLAPWLFAGSALVILLLVLATLAKLFGGGLGIERRSLRSAAPN